MKKLFLTSLFNSVGDKIAETLPKLALQTAFIPTAADVYESKPWMEADRQKLVELGYQVEDYDIKNKTEAVIYNDLKNKDVIFVSGGNCFYLLYQVRKSGFDKAIERLTNEGKIYVGSSAGSILLAPTIEPAKPLDNSEQAPKLSSFQGLGMVDFVVLPHYGKEKYEARYQAIIKEWSSKVKLMPLTDTQFIIVEGSKSRIIE